MEWCEWAETIAYGPLNLTPEQFEQLQPHEFELLVEGYDWRENHNGEIMAYFVSKLMSVHTKNPVKVTDLWKSKKGEQ